MRNFLQRRFVNLLFVIAIAVLLFTSFLVYEQIQHLLNANERVVHTHEVLEKINKLLVEVIDDDRLEAAYMDSNDQKYLNKFEQTLQDIPIKFAELRAATVDNPWQLQRLEKLEPLINKRVATAQGIIQTYKISGRAAANQQRLAEHDQDLIDTIKLQVEDINNAEVALLQQSNSIATYNSHKSSLIVITVSVLSDLLLLLSFVLLNHHVVERQTAEKKKQDAERSLAGIIENTNDLIVAMDTELRFTAFNKAYEEKFFQMHHCKIAVGMYFSDAIASSPNREEVLLHWQRALAGEEFTVSTEWGKGIFYEATFNAIKNENHRSIGASKIMRNVTQRHLEEVILKDANLTLNHGLVELKNRYHAMALLNEMSEVLQSCMTTEEAYLPIKTYCQQVLPYKSGVLYVMHPSQTYLEIVTEWGQTINKERVFAPDQCWGLRRNQIHKVDNPDSNIICGHIMASDKDAAYICIPLMAHNETLGLLFLEGPTHEDKYSDSRISNEHQRLLLITAEKQMSLALANIKLRETLRHLSIRDPLTGLYNRRYLEETLNREFHRAERKKLSLAIVMIDIDHFKRFNDTYGHDAGDYILKFVGKIFQEEARGSDIVCRYGGEEFLVFMYDTDRNAAQAYAERTRTSLAQLSLQYGAIKLGSLTISQGIAIFPTDGVMPSTLIEGADHALYKAKKAGRDKIVFMQDALG
jgi:diguanylate cyclase (GGDEF)-like protein/PAS domain S-box-containing protein